MNKTNISRQIQEICEFLELADEIHLFGLSELTLNQYTDIG